MMIEWINEKYNVNLTHEDLEQVKLFTLLWNIFENELFNTHFSATKLRAWVDGNQFDINLFEEDFNYFRERYTQEEYRFNILFPTRQGRENERGIVFNFLTNETTSIRNKIYSLGMICYRFRNNLFHGNKQVEELPTQIENFIRVNNVLRNFLETPNN
jgi:hypothetical protein